MLNRIDSERICYMLSCLRRDVNNNDYVVWKGVNAILDTVKTLFTEDEYKSILVTMKYFDKYWVAKTDFNSDGESYCELTKATYLIQYFTKGFVEQVIGNENAEEKPKKRDIDMS